MSTEDLGAEFDKLEANVRGSVQIGGGTDSREMLGVTLLGQAIVKLDKTSTELAKANIELTRVNVRLTKMYTLLTVAILAVSTIQAVLMMSGH
jgi:hypothetical protein